MKIRSLLLGGLTALSCQIAASAPPAPGTAPQKCAHPNLLPLFKQHVDRQVKEHPETVSDSPPGTSVFLPQELATVPEMKLHRLQLRQPHVQILATEDVLFVSDCEGHLIGDRFSSSDETLIPPKRGPTLPTVGETVEMESDLVLDNGDEFRTVYILGVVDSALKTLWKHYSYIRGPKLEKEYQMHWQSPDHFIEVTGEIRAYPDSRSPAPRKVTPVHETYCWSRKATSYVACAGKAILAPAAATH